MKHNIIIIGMMATIMIFALGAAGKPQERVLVLGFDSQQLNDVQDRLLRETMLREFHERGYRIVPVMEIETLIYGDVERKIRKLHHADVRSLCDELQAGYAFYGVIFPFDNSKDDEIKKGKKYKCVITLYRKDKNKFYDIKFKSEGQESLYQFFDAISKIVVAEVDKLL